jgi:hypothetical protein
MTGRKDKADEKRARNFIESFNALSLAAQERPRTAPIPDGVASSHHFPVPSAQWPPHLNNAAGIPPPPILYSRDGIPLQSSLTMQHAIAESLQYNAPTTPPRVPVHRPVGGPSHTPTGLYADKPVPRPVSEPLFSPPSRDGHPRTPQPPKLQAPKVHRRAQSEPLSPVPSGSVGGSRQCSGITAAGKQCRKQVKVSDVQALGGGDAFCHVHDRKLSEVTGFYDRKTGETFIKFEGECT